MIALHVKTSCHIGYTFLIFVEIVALVSQNLVFNQRMHKFKFRFCIMLINFVIIIVFLLRFLNDTFSKVRIKTKNNINI